jgi:hypothetical protein
MKIVLFFLFGLFLSLASTSCTPENITDTQTEQIKTLASDPPSEEPGEEGELDPNG